MDFVTADLHFGHSRIIEYQNRPFANVSQMDERMVLNWNEIVSNRDRVFVVGDLALAKHITPWTCQLNGSVYVIPGSHDWAWLSIMRDGDGVIPFTRAGPITILPLIHMEKINKTYIVFCHYAMRSWPRSVHKSILLHGHSHNKLDPMHNSLDIGVDGNRFYPWNIHEAVTAARLIQK